MAQLKDPSAAINLPEVVYTRFHIKNLNDNIKLKSTYITNILKCVPPEDKPLSNEISNCSNFFDQEILSLKFAS